jgi:hypothetical protein
LPDYADGEVEVWKGNDGYEAYGYAARGYFWVQLPGVGVFRFRKDDRTVVAVSETGVPEPIIDDAYRRNVLPLILSLRGYEVLHASAVSTPDGILVLCGVSGTGKSTFAHALSERGYPAWADDAVVVDVGGRGVVALAIPFRLRLHGPAVTHFEWAEPEVADGEATRSPVLALAILAQDSSATQPLVEVERLPPAEAFTALLRHAYYFRLSDLARSGVLVQHNLGLASIVPTFEVRYRSGLDHLSRVLDAVEEVVLAG